jgi:hypothetical protein
MVLNLHSVQTLLKEAERRVNMYIFDFYGLRTYDFVLRYRASSNPLFFVKVVIHFTLHLIRAFVNSIVSNWQLTASYITSVCCPNGA